MGLEFWLYDPSGQKRIGSLDGQLKGSAIALRSGGDVTLLRHLRKGSKVRVNNLFYLALHFYEASIHGGA